MYASENMRCWQLVYNSSDFLSLHTTVTYLPLTLFQDVSYSPTDVTADQLFFGSWFESFPSLNCNTVVLPVYCTQHARHKQCVRAGLTSLKP
jgi:hypothetical protein